MNKQFIRVTLGLLFTALTSTFLRPHAPGGALYAPVKVAKNSVVEPEYMLLASAPVAEHMAEPENQVAPEQDQPQSFLSSVKEIGCCSWDALSSGLTFGKKITILTYVLAKKSALATLFLTKKSYQGLHWLTLLPYRGYRWASGKTQQEELDKVQVRLTSAQIIFTMNPPAFNPAWAKQ